VGTTLAWHGAPLLDAQAYGALVLVVLATTVLTPPLLKWALARSAGS
jgi:hypothetical protein